MPKRNIYIKPEDEARLAAMGSGRSENLRRALALAECAGELAEALEFALNMADSSPVAGQFYENIEHSRALLDKYREIKQ